MGFEQVKTELIRLHQRPFLKSFNFFEDKLIENPELLQDIDKATILTLLQKAFDLKRNLLVELIGRFCNNMSPLLRAIIQDDVWWAELFLKNGEKLEDLEIDASLLARYLFEKKNINLYKDMLLVLLKHGLNTVIKKQQTGNLLSIFINNVDKKDEDAIEIADILINYGTPINEMDRFGSTPLISSIHSRNIELTSFLIKKGADLDILTPFYYSGIVGMSFLEDENKIGRGMTTLHSACISCCEETIGLLIRKGAKISPLDVRDWTPFSVLLDQVNYDKKCVAAMVKGFSRLIFEKISVYKPDMELIRADPWARDYFQKCILELEEMANTKFYGHYSYYFVLKMSKNIKKLASLTKNEEFSAAFEENLSSFSYYQSDLRAIWDEAIQLKNETFVVSSRLNSVFVNFLPDVILRKLAQNLSVSDLPLN